MLTNSILIQTDDGRRYDSSIQYNRIIDDPYYRKPKLPLLRPILAMLTIVGVITCLVMSENLGVSSFPFAVTTDSKYLRTKPNIGIGSSSIDETSVDDAKEQQQEGQSNDEEHNALALADDDVDDELRGTADDDTRYDIVEDIDEHSEENGSIDNTAADINEKIEKSNIDHPDIDGDIQEEEGNKEDLEKHIEGREDDTTSYGAGNTRLGNTYGIGTYTNSANVSVPAVPLSPATNSGHGNSGRVRESTFTSTTSNNSGVYNHSANSYTGSNSSSLVANGGATSRTSSNGIGSVGKDTNSEGGSSAAEDNVIEEDDIHTYDSININSSDEADEKIVATNKNDKYKYAPVADFGETNFDSNKNGGKSNMDNIEDDNINFTKEQQLPKESPSAIYRTITNMVDVDDDGELFDEDDQS